MNEQEVATGNQNSAEIVPIKCLKHISERFSSVVFSSQKGTGVAVLELFHYKVDNKELILLLLSQNAVIEVWNLENREKLLELDGKHDKKILCLNCYQYENHAYVVTGGEDNKANVWKLSFGGLVGEKLLKTHLITFNSDGETHSKGISGVKILEIKDPRSLKPSQRSTRLAPIVILASNDRTGSVWSLPTGTQPPEAQPPQSEQKPLEPLYMIPAKHTDLINSVTAYCDGDESYEQVTIITAATDKTIRFWRFGAEQHETVMMLGHKKLVTSVILHSFQMGQYLFSEVAITASLDRTVRVWDLRSRKLIRKLLGHEDKVSSVRVIDTEMSGLPPLIVSSSDDQTIRLWNLLDGECIRVLTCPQKCLNVSVLAAGYGHGFVISTGTDKGLVYVYNFMHNEYIRRLKTSAVTAIDLYYPREKEPVKELQDPKIIIGTIDSTCPIFSYTDRSHDQAKDLNKKSIAPRKTQAQGIVDKEGEGGIWKLGSSREERNKEINGHTNRINALVVYTPRDVQHPPLVVTCSADLCVKVWDLLTRQCIKSIHIKEDFALISLAVYNPELCNHPGATASSASASIASQYPQAKLVKDGFHEIDLSKPWIICGGIKAQLYFIDLLAPPPPSTDTCIFKIHDTKHKGMIRHIYMHHSISFAEKPFFITSSYDGLAKTWDLESLGELKVYGRDVHRGYVFQTDVYDPRMQYPSIDNAPSRNKRKIMACGCYDNQTYLWDLETAEKLHVLRGHTDSVTCLKIYVNQQDPKDEPLLVTGSVDNLVIIWNLLSGERLQTLIGHMDRVCFLNIYNPPLISANNNNDNNDKNHKKDLPTVITGSDDKSNIVWYDALYQEKEHMPSRDNVKRAFDMDLRDEDWPMITYYASLTRGKLFHENSYLFFLAVQKQRPDFLLKFRVFLTQCIRFIDISEALKELDDGGSGGTHTKHHHHHLKHHSSTYSNLHELYQEVTKIAIITEKEKTSLLHYAVYKSDLISTRAILLSWVECLNQDITNVLDQKLYHATYFFPDKDLEDLAKKYPIEFVLFITSLRLVRNHEFLLLNRVPGKEIDRRQFPLLKEDKRFDDERFTLTSASSKKRLQLQLEQKQQRQQQQEQEEQQEMMTVSPMMTTRTETGLSVDDVEYSQAYEENKGMSIVEMKTGNSMFANTEASSPTSTASASASASGRMSPLPMIRQGSIVKIEEDRQAYEESTVKEVRLIKRERYEVTGIDQRVQSFSVVWEDHLQRRVFASQVLQEIKDALSEEPFSNKQPVTSLLVPLRNIANLDYIMEMLVEVSYQLDNVEIFDCEVGKMALQFGWEKYGRNIHIRGLGFYLVFMALYLCCVYTFQFQYNANEGPAVTGLVNVFNVFILCLFVLYEYLEVQQVIQSHLYEYLEKDEAEAGDGTTPDSIASVIPSFGNAAAGNAPATSQRPHSINRVSQEERLRREKSISGGVDAGNASAAASATTNAAAAFAASNTTTTAKDKTVGKAIWSHHLLRKLLLHFFQDLWNIIDQIVIISGFIGIAMRLRYQQDIDVGRCFLSTSSVAMWFKVLYFMRPFRSSGPLVVMIIKIAHDIRMLLLVLFCVLCGFAQAFWLLSNIDSSLPFGTVENAFYNTFLYMVGQNIDPFFDGTVSSRFASLLLILFLIFMTLLMLNLLIALMGDTFSKVRSLDLALWRREQASIVMEQASVDFTRADRKYPEFLHVLKYTSEIKSDPPEAFQRLTDLVASCVEQVPKFTPFEVLNFDNDEFIRAAREYAAKNEENAKSLMQLFKGNN